jgi:integrase
MKLTKKDLEKFLADVPRTETYRDLCNDILKGFVGRELDEDEVKKYARGRYRNANSYNLCLAIFKSLANYLMKRLPQDDLKEYIRNRQALELITDIKRKRVVMRVEKKGLEVEELERILKKLPRDSLKFSVIWLLHYFGVRPGELVALRPKMVDFRRRTVVFESEKTKVERELHFDEFTAVHLRRFLKASPSYSYVHKICRGAGIRPKSGRQSFISHMQRSLSRALDLVKLDILIKVASGHTVSSDITATYTDLQRDLERAFKEFHYLREMERRFA